MTRFKDATDIAAWRMCIGCGACVSACPDRKLEMVDLVDEGLRPLRTSSGPCSGCTACVDVCPGIALREPAPAGPQYIESLRKSWGPVLQVWEGHAADAGLQFNGSSGGLASALALYAVEQAGMAGVVHVGNDDVVRYRNRTTFSTTREQLLASTGSRYAPASPCDGLGMVEGLQAPAAFIGKPCDVAGARKLQDLRPGVKEKLGLAIGIFCAGTPSTQGTLDLLARHGIKPEEVEELRYRGRGWPGHFAVRRKGSSEWTNLATYEEAWAFLQSYRPYRCHLCPDSTAEFADISCGDPWYRPIEPGEAGSSLVLARTERGREIVEGAIRAGYVKLKVVEPKTLDLSQKELQRKRGAIWGRTLSLRTLGIPAPGLSGFSLFSNWLRIPLRDKVRSVAGTIRRAISRGMYRPNARHLVRPAGTGVRDGER
jgi:coenzyme F420 hydrogenase subunit beta